MFIFFILKTMIIIFWWIHGFFLDDWYKSCDEECWWELNLWLLMSADLAAAS